MALTVTCALFGVLALTTLMSCTLPATQLAGVALVYGVSVYDSDYAEGVGNNLTYSDDDAVAVAAMLSASGYQVTLRIDAQATLENLAADIEQTVGLIAENGNFVFYFSGHGVSSFVGAADGAENEPGVQNRFDEWIFLYGSADYDSITDLSKALSDDGMRELFSPVPTSRKMVLIDACNSGGFIGSQLDIDAIPQDSDASAREGLLAALETYAAFLREPTSDLPASDTLIIAAAGEQEDTYEYTTYGHGVFTYHLLNAPAEGDLNQDGFVTTVECYAYVSGMVEATWESIAFQPRISGGPVDFALFRSTP